MAISFESIKNNIYEGLLIVDILMENFEEIIINEQANNCRRSPFHRPYSHSMNPFDRLIDGSDIVALTLNHA